MPVTCKIRPVAMLYFEVKACRVNFNAKGISQLQCIFNAFVNLLLTLSGECERMYCAYGALCVVDKRTQQAHCRCQETCVDVFAPVCGSDKVTYSSDCQLRMASCSKQKRIFTKHQGPCGMLKNILMHSSTVWCFREDKSFKHKSIFISILFNSIR